MLNFWRALWSDVTVHSLHVVELVLALLQLILQLLFVLQVRALLRQEAPLHLQLELLAQTIDVGLRVLEHLHTSTTDRFQSGEENNNKSQRERTSTMSLALSLERSLDAATF